MLLEPTLIVRELLVTRGPHTAYRARFSEGVNIISGENSSGKSTLLNLLVYGLGADVSNWSEHAKLCDQVRVHVELNGRPVVFSRDISSRSQQGMDIFAGTMEEAEKSSISDWSRYPYRGTGTKISFSQAIFGLLKIPELQTETTGRITIHQILRLLYSDQMTPAENIFRSEPFDSNTVKDAIGRFVFGAYDNEIYANEIELKALKSELQDISSALKSIYAVLGRVQHGLTQEWVQAELSNIENELNDLQKRISGLELKTDSEEELSLRPQQEALARVQDLQTRITHLDQEIASLELETADSALFIMNLERKISALQDSASTADVVAEIRYIWCPSCFSKLPDDDNGETCRLCKEPFDRERTQRRIVIQMNDIRNQVGQSKALQRVRTDKLAALTQDRASALSEWQQAQAALKRVQSSPTTESRAALRALMEKAGYLRRQMEVVNEKAALIGQLDELSQRKEDINKSIAHLEDRNERLRATERDRLAKAYTEVADETVWFLKNDLPRQDSFQNPRLVSFNFEKDRITVDGESYFSASSVVLLKNSFLAGLLFAAVDDPEFRHFRLAILDTLEDKGMEPERSQNFQRLLVNRSEKSENVHQLIFATAMVAPELADSEYIVGQYSTHDSRTLNIQ